MKASRIAIATVVVAGGVAGTAWAATSGGLLPRNPLAPTPQVSGSISVWECSNDPTDGLPPCGDERIIGAFVHPSPSLSPSSSPTKDAFVYDTQVPLPPPEYGIDLSTGTRLEIPQQPSYQLLSSNQSWTRDELNAQVKSLYEYYQERMADDGWTVTALGLKDTPTGDGVAEGSIDAGIRLTKDRDLIVINVASWTGLFGAGFRLNMTVLERTLPTESSSPA